MVTWIYADSKWWQRSTLQQPKVNHAHLVQRKVCDLRWFSTIFFFFFFPTDGKITVGISLVTEADERERLRELTVK